MYKAYKNVADFNTVLQDEWTFENAFFDFDGIVWGQAKTDIQEIGFQIDKPLHYMSMIMRVMQVPQVFLKLAGQ